MNCKANQSKILSYQSIGRSSVLLAIITVFSSAGAFAEKPGGVPRNQRQAPGPMVNHAPGANVPGMDPFHLLTNNKEVQKDLRLTETQLHQLSSISGNFRTQMRDSSFRTKEQIQLQTQSGKAMVGKVLNLQQVERLKQIMHQIDGPCGILADPKLLNHLSIEVASAQYKKLESICQQVNAQIRTLGETSANKYPNDSCKVMVSTWTPSLKIKKIGLDQLSQSMTVTQQNALTKTWGRAISFTPMNNDYCNKTQEVKL